MYLRRLQNNSRDHSKSFEYKVNTHCNSIAVFHRYMFKGKGLIHKYTDNVTDLDTPSIKIERGEK